GPARRSGAGTPAAPRPAARGVERQLVLQQRGRLILSLDLPLGRPGRDHPPRPAPPATGQRSSATAAIARRTSPPAPRPQPPPGPPGPEPAIAGVSGSEQETVPKA